MFNNVSVKKKLISLFILPLVAIVILISGLILSLTSEYHNATQAASVEEMKKIGDLIHEIQVERGLSAGFLASNGKNTIKKL